MKRRYQPSETHIALHPARELLTCSNPDCKVKFAARPTTDHDEDDPGKCLKCNRSSWSKLWEPEEQNETTTTTTAGTEFNLVSDDDVGEVVSMSVRRPRK